MILQLTLSFYSSLVFLTEAVFIQEQITECRFEDLLGISDKFSSKLNIFTYMILHCWHSIQEIFIAMNETFSNGEKKQNINILIWHMLGEMVTKWCRERFYLSCNNSCALYISVKILLVKLKNFHTSGCLNLNYDTTKQKSKMRKVQRWWDLSKHVVNTITNLILVILSALQFPPHAFCWGKLNFQRILSGRNE